MSGVQRFLLLLSFVLLFALGGIQLAYINRWVWATGWVEAQIALLPWWSRIAWCVLLMITPLCFALISAQRLSVQRLLILKTEAGASLKIRESAVNRFVQDRLATLPFVKAVRVRSRARGGALDLKVRVWVLCSEQLDNLQEKVLQKVTTDARYGLGVGRMTDPDIQFEAVRTRKRDPIEAPLAAQEPRALAAPDQEQK